MPDYARLETDVRCPRCDAPIHDEIWFQWGYCPGYGSRPEGMYRLGDAIRWRARADGTVPAWTSFEAGGSNIGDPAVRDLVVRDRAQEWLSQPCPSCQASLAGPAIEIRDGVILRAWLSQPGEFSTDADIYLLEEDGKRRPMPEWDDHPMATGAR